ncbi:hypothetical protein M0P65_03235 [Candidatus Gracilibacteria bacterium]|nr:hypothetical protein [Candidatus Gracilibacteria bacterium]
MSKLEGISLRSCKHRNNIIHIKENLGEVIINGEGESSWSSERQKIINTTLNKVMVLLLLGKDNDITVTFENEEKRQNIPIVIGNPGNNSGDIFNNPNIYNFLLQKLQGAKKLNINQEISEILNLI